MQDGANLLGADEISALVGLEVVGEEVLQPLLGNDIDAELDGVSDLDVACLVLLGSGDIVGGLDRE